MCTGTGAALHTNAHVHLQAPYPTPGRRLTSGGPAGAGHDRDGGGDQAARARGPRRVPGGLPAGGLRRARPFPRPAPRLSAGGSEGLSSNCGWAHIAWVLLFILLIGLLSSASFCHEPCLKWSTRP